MTSWLTLRERCFRRFSFRKCVTCLSSLLTAVIFSLSKPFRLYLIQNPFSSTNCSTFPLESSQVYFAKKKKKEFLHRVKRGRENNEATSQTSETTITHSSVKLYHLYATYFVGDLQKLEKKATHLCCFSSNWQSDHLPAVRRMRILMSTPSASQSETPVLKVFRLYL